MRRGLRRVTVGLLALASAATLRAQTRPVIELPYIEVFLRGEKRDVKVAGRLTQYDDARLTIQTPGGSRDLLWDQLTPSSGFTLKTRLIDKGRAAEWLEVGRWGWQRGLEAQARAAFAQATKLDGGLVPQVAAIVATAPGTRVAPPAAAASDVGARVATSKPIVERSQGEPSRPTERGGNGGGAIIRYVASTPEENAASIALSRRRKDEAEAVLKVKLAEIATEHFLIYTDWPAADHKFLRDECENAYRAVARQFDQPAKENVFVGKLPIYMFATSDTFRRFALEVDEHELPETVLGYFVPVDEMGHMAMWKPGVGTGIGAGGSYELARRNWGRTLVHEFCHAFFHRYKSNARIPRWLNEGTAELISEGVLPSNNYYATARDAAQQKVDVTVLFNEDHRPTGVAYPVMMTLVECLVSRDRRAFPLLINDLKDGVSPEAALLNRYKLDYAGLATAWRAYALKLR